MLLIFEFSHDGFDLIVDRFFCFFSRFFFCFWFLLRDWTFLCFVAVLEVNLRRKSSWFEKLNVIVSAWTNIFVVHKPLKSNNPRPFLIRVSSTKIKFLIIRSDFESSWNHLFVFTKVAFVWFYLFELNNVSDLFAGFVGESEQVIHCQDNPTFTPFFEKLWAFVQRALSDFAILQFVFQCFLVHLDVDVLSLILNWCEFIN